jgi:S1/P1 Nuclease
MKRYPAFLLAVVVLFAANNGLAWGPDGHKTVCRIAYQLLDDPQRAEVDRLTKAYKLPNGVKPGYTSFPEACTFADRARGNAQRNLKGWTRFTPFNEWHFLNVPRTVKHVAATFCAGNCVVHGIEFHGSQLANMALGDQKRAEALMFLGHWVGDIHQPLHISYADDRGGNDILVQSSFFTQPKLHMVWDSGFIGHDEGSGTNAWIAFADRLKSGITAAQQTQWLAVTAPIDWADESYAITITPDVQYCKMTASGNSCNPIKKPRNLAAPYQNEFQTDVETRLQQAGVRLAGLLKQDLGK